MKTKVLKYNVIIRREGKQYIAYVPSLGISDFGSTIHKAKSNVHNAILCHVEGLIKTNSEIPHPDTDEFYISQSTVLVPESTSFTYS